MSVTHTTTENQSSDIVGRILLLAGVLVLAGLVVIGVGAGLLSASLKTGLLAWLVCTVSAVVAHVCGEYPKGVHNFAARMAIQMMVRTAIPFLVVIWGLKFAKPPLETSLVFYILSFYLVGTLADVQLHVRRLKAIADQSGQLS